MTATALTAGCQKAEEPIAWINDLPVTREEAALFTSASDPKDIKKGVDELVWYKILQGKMVESGKLKDASYEYFLTLLEEENESRAEKEAMGEILYGPVQYTEKAYYEYLSEKYEEAWKDSIVLEEDEEVLRKMYEEDETLYQIFGDTTFLYLSFVNGESAADVKKLRNRLCEEVASGASFKEAVEEEGYGELLDERTFTQDDLSMPDVTNYPEISEIVYGLEEGEISQVVELNPQFLIFYCSERNDGGRSSFEECRDVLFEQYKEEYIDELKQTACDEAVIYYSDDFQKELDESEKEE